MKKSSKSTVVINNRKIELSNPDRILFPKVRITKKELVDYYIAVAPLMMRLIDDHPLTLQRYPSGIHAEGFYQKDAGSYFPSWITPMKVGKQEGGSVNYVVATTPATIVYLANQATITFHTWLSRADKIRYPDRMIFDLDPSGKDFDQVRQAALAIKDILDSFSIKSFVMATGSRGLHVVAPLRRIYTFDEVAEAAYHCAELLIQQAPKKYTLEIRKQKRGKRIFIDTLRNRYSATAVAPYSVRVKDRASVALPLSWREVHNPKLRSDGMTIKDLKKILARKTEWTAFTRVQNNLKGLLAASKK